MLKDDNLLKKVTAVPVKDKSFMSEWCFQGKSEVLVMMQTSLMNETICMTTMNQKNSSWLMNNKKRKGIVTQMLKAMQHWKSFHKNNISFQNALKSPRRRRRLTRNGRLTAIAMKNSTLKGILHMTSR